MWRRQGCFGSVGTYTLCWRWQWKRLARCRWFRLHVPTAHIFACSGLFCFFFAPRCLDNIFWLRLITPFEQKNERNEWLTSTIHHLLLQARSYLFLLHHLPLFTDATTRTLLDCSWALSIASRSIYWMMVFVARWQAATVYTTMTSGIQWISVEPTPLFSFHIDRTPQKCD